MKLIDSNDLYKVGAVNHGMLHVANVDTAPRYDVEPVIHAKWVDTRPMWLIGGQRPPSARFQCSNCNRRTGSRQKRTYRYCPKCGAKMDLEDV